MSVQQPLKILIADDHKMFGDALRTLLLPHFSEVSHVADGYELLFHVRKAPPDLILLDINLPRLNGFDAAEQIRQSYPKIRIVLVSMYNQQRMLKQAKEMGLEGYLLKDSPSQLLLAGIEKVLKGETFYDPKLTRNELQRKDSFSNEFMLTEREKQIIRRLVQGMKAKDIADDLGLKYETVKSHRKNIYLKLGISSLLELAAVVKSSLNDMD